ncbi:MAG: TonB-dependent receptor domain-containing protein [Flavobacteriales bacterium]
MKRHRLICGIFFTLFVQTGFTQSKTAKGVVLEEDTKGNLIPIAGAVVFWRDTDVNTSTNALGVFKIPYHETSNQLIISYIGFTPDTIQVRKNDSLKVILKNATTLKTFEVAGKRAATYISAIDPLKTEIMTEQELFKAACCNLSESFENNATVDVSFADAVTGTRQVMMLGLAGPYTHLTRENLPGPRGLHSNFGLALIPGPWIESISINKGVGSVVNGYESMSSQINVELKKPDCDETWFFNGYYNTMGRQELNVKNANKLNAKWSNTTMLHFDQMQNEWDMNTDNFLDVPKSKQGQLLHRWRYDDGNGWSGQVGIRALADQKEGGQLSNLNLENPFRFTMDQTQGEVFGKLGYVFPEQKYKSFGSMYSFSAYENQSMLGTRNYTGKQQTGYANFIYQSIINNTNHKFKTGLSFVYENIREQMNEFGYHRIEYVPGVFFEYMLTASRFNLIPGMRVDYSTNFGLQFTPRIHAKYQLLEETVWRFAAGRGWRAAGFMAENISPFVSSRNVVIQNTGFVAPNSYPFSHESAWNYGTSITHEIHFLGREGQFTIDAHSVFFDRQVLVDLYQSSQILAFRQLNGEFSRVNAIQADFNMEIVQRLDLRLSYKWTDSRAQFSTGIKERPFVPRQRALINLGYRTRGNKWMFDATGNFTGTKQLPSTAENPVEFRFPERTPSFWQFHAQITRSFKNFDVFMGGENLSSFGQQDLINAWQDPFGPFFDASLVWGPAFGRMYYVGFRWKLHRKK